MEQHLWCSPELPFNGVVVMHSNSCNSATVCKCNSASSLLVAIECICMCMCIVHCASARNDEGTSVSSRPLIAVSCNLCMRIEIEIYAWQIFNLILSVSLCISFYPFCTNIHKFHFWCYSHIHLTRVHCAPKSQNDVACVNRVYILV